MINLMQTLQNLKEQRDKINNELMKGEEVHENLMQRINMLKEKSQQISKELEQKQEVLNVYDKILSESESAYNKIVQSTHALYEMVKNEEKKFMG